MLAALRAGTRDLHARTEAAFVLGGTEVTHAVYAAVLVHLAAYYARTEAALAPWAPALAPLGLDVAARQKTALLWRDLAAIGAAPDEEAGPIPAMAPALVPASAPVIPNAATALGTLYVLEGATLGGQLLRRRLGPALGLTAEAGLAFFSAYGADVGPMWRAFTTAVDRFDHTTPAAVRPGRHAAAVAGARTAFLAFEHDVVTPTALLAAHASAHTATHGSTHGVARARTRAPHEQHGPSVTA